MDLWYSPARVLLAGGSGVLVLDVLFLRYFDSRW